MMVRDFSELKQNIKATIQKKNFWLNLGFFAVIVVAAYVRLINLGSGEILGDEGNYILRAAGWNDFMFSNILTTPWNWFIQQDFLPAWTQLAFFDHPPVHFATIWLSTHLFGINLTAGRLPAALAGIFSVIMMMLVIRRFSSDFASLAGGAVLAILPWHIWISRHAQQESLVILFIILAIWLLQSINKQPKSWRWWMLLGLTLAAGILTKYSFIVILPLLIWEIFCQRFWQKPQFWAMCLLVLVLLIPQIYYEAQTYAARGHFDLQLARFLGQNQQTDWSANQKLSFTANISALPSVGAVFIKNFSLPAIIILLIGWVIYLAGHFKGIKDNFLPGYLVLFLLVFAIVLLTDSEAAPGAVVIPFFILALGSALKYFDNRVGRAAIIVVLILFLLAPSWQKADSRAAWLGQVPIAAPQFGFTSLDAWLQKQYPPKWQASHYLSLRDWVGRSNSKIMDDPRAPVIIFDNTFDYFNLQWFAFRYSLYNQNYAVMHPEIFVNYLLQGNEAVAQLPGRQIVFIQSLLASRDSKTGWPATFKPVVNHLNDLVKQQNIEPIIFYRADHEPFAQVWQVTWQN